jgi:hypothetical protein
MRIEKTGFGIRDSGWRFAVRNLVSVPRLLIPNSEFRIPALPA